MWYMLDGRPGQLIIETEIRPDFLYEGKRYNSISCGYNTKEELFVKQRILEKPCVICGRLIVSTYYGREKLIEKNMCFGCSLWDDRVTEINNNPDRKLVVNGVMYSIGPEDKNQVFRGFAGHKFTFLTNFGKVIESTNVWCGGDVPSYFKEKIPDNAVFIEK